MISLNCKYNCTFSTKKGMSFTLEQFRYRYIDEIVSLQFCGLLDIIITKNQDVYVVIVDKKPIRNEVKGGKNGILCTLHHPRHGIVKTTAAAFPSCIFIIISPLYQQVCASASFLCGMANYYQW